MPGLNPGPLMGVMAQDEALWWGGVLLGRWLWDTMGNRQAFKDATQAERGLPWGIGLVFEQPGWGSHCPLSRLALSSLGRGQLFWHEWEW